MRKNIVIAICFLALLIAIGILLNRFIHNEDLLIATRVAKQAANQPTPTGIDDTPTRNQTTLYGISRQGIAKILSFGPIDPRFGFAIPTLDTNTGKVYYVADYGSIHQYNLQTKQDTTFYTTPDNTKEFVDPKIQNTTLLDVTQISRDINTYDQEKYIREFNLADGTSRLIGPIKQSAYTNGIELFSYNGVDYTGAFGGDGCGGYGAIYNNTTQEALVKTGGGCVPDPRYIGTIPDQHTVILYSVLPNNSKTVNSDNPFQYTFDSLYSKNLVTGNVTPIFDLTIIPYSDNTEILFDQQNKQVGILSQNQLWVISLANKTLEKKIPLPIPYTYQNAYVLLGNMIYIWVNDQQKFMRINTDSNVVDSTNWKFSFSDTMWENIYPLGVWNNIFYVAVGE